MRTKTIIAATAAVCLSGVVAAAAPPIFNTAKQQAYGQPVKPAAKRGGPFARMRRAVFGQKAEAQPGSGQPYANQGTGWQPPTAQAGMSTPFPAVGPQPKPGPVQRFQQALASNPLTQAFSSGDKRSGEVDGALSLNTPAAAPGPDVLLNMAKVAATSGDQDAARRLLQQAIAADPTSIEALRQLGRLEDGAGRLAEAEKLYLQAVAADPTSGKSLNDLGLCYARQGKLEQSRATLEEAIRQRPDKVLYRNNVAKVLVTLGNPDRAAAHLAAVHGQVAAEYNVGQLLATSGNVEEGTRRIRRAVSLDPGFTPAVEALAALEAATPARTQGGGATQVATRPELPSLPPSRVQPLREPVTTPPR